MKNTQSIIFHAEWHDEPSAGIRGGYERVTVSFEYGGNVMDTDFIDYWRSTVKDYYDGAIVYTEDEWKNRLRHWKECGLE
jgi:hypothetical protein